MQTPAADVANEAGVIRGKSPLHQALEAVVKIERTKVITGPNDSVGVLLYNVDVSPKSREGGVALTHSLLKHRHQAVGTSVMAPT